MARALLVVIAALLVADGAGASARSKSPPAGSYECTVGAYQQVSGTLRIFSHHRYRFRKGRLGHFTVTGTRMTFTSGGWQKKYSARWHRLRSGVVEIGLVPVGRRAATKFCDRS